MRVVVHQKLIFVNKIVFRSVLEDLLPIDDWRRHTGAYRPDCRTGGIIVPARLSRGSRGNFV